MVDDLPPRKSGALTYPEPLGPVQAYCGMTSIFTLLISVRD